VAGKLCFQRIPGLHNPGKTDIGPTAKTDLVQLFGLAGFERLYVEGVYVEGIMSDLVGHGYRFGLLRRSFCQLFLRFLAGRFQSFIRTLPEDVSKLVLMALLINAPFYAIFQTRPSFC